MSTTMNLKISDVRQGQRPGFECFPYVMVPSHSATFDNGEPKFRLFWMRAQYRPKTQAHSVGRWALLRPDGRASGRIISEIDAPLWFDQYEIPVEVAVDDQAD